MTIVDERGRIFGKFNIIDLIVLLAIIGLILAAVGLKNRNSTSRQEKKDTIILSFLDEAVRPEVASMIKVGDTLYVIGGKPLGKIISLRTSPSRLLWVQKDGTQVEDPVRRDLFVEVKGEGYLSDERTDVGGNQVFIGEIMRMRTNRVRMDAELLDIKKYENR